MPLVLGLLLLSAVSVQDDYGNAVALDAPAQRIVSFSPHLTELLYAAGAGGRVVGVDEYSDYPPPARALPRVGSEAGIDLEAVLALQPDLVVAWPNAGSRRTIDRVAELGIPVFRSEPRELEDIPRTIERLGVLAGTASGAAEAFRRKAAALQARYGARPPVRVFYQVWDRPLQTVNGDHVISKVIRLCGGVNVFADLPVIAPHIDREALLRADPEVIVTSDPGTKVPAGLEAWRERVHFIDPGLIQRHTPRLLEGAERLCRILDRARATR